MIRSIRIPALAAGALLATALNSAAQDPAGLEAEMRKKMEEISRLMRDSEERLLAMTHVDRIIEQQEEVVRRLKELLPPAEAERQAAEEMEKRRADLERTQGELTRKIEELLEGQKAASEQTVQQLQELLRSLPRQQQQGGGDSDEKRQQKSKPDEQKRLDEKKDQDRQQRDTPQDPRSKQEEEAKKREQMRGGKKPQDETEAAARMRRIEAWIARLPPEEQARINRNDFSSIPLRYRQLVQEYTALRAKREAEQDGDR